jgi:hypothetical protein
MNLRGRTRVKSRTALPATTLCFFAHRITRDNEIPDLTTASKHESTLATRLEKSVKPDAFRNRNK